VVDVDRKKFGLCKLLIYCGGANKKLILMEGEGEDGRLRLRKCSSEVARTIFLLLIVKLLGTIELSRLAKFYYFTYAE
jgi:hypothetical protein